MAPPLLRRSVANGRGHAVTVTLRRTTALAPLLEGISLADEAIASADRIYNAALAGNRQLVVNEAGRLTVRARAARSELRRMAALVEKP